MKGAGRRRERDRRGGGRNKSERWVRGGEEV